jgi:hypothetical protein
VISRTKLKFLSHCSEEETSKIAVGGVRHNLAAGFFAMCPLILSLQLRGPVTALSRKFLHDLTTARHFKSCCNMRNKNIYNENLKFQLRGNNSVCAGAFQLLRGRARPQLRGNIGSLPHNWQLL